MGNVAEYISTGKAVLGIELGSTRIKAVLIDENHKPIASGAYDWENKLENGVWTYALEEAWKGVAGCYASLVKEVEEKYGVTLTKVAAIGISGMMHGYLPFDKEGKQLAGFRTWRNTMTEAAAAKLTEALAFNIPQRWSIAHLYQAILNGEDHVGQIDFITTLAGYIHWQLTGERVMGVGEASGMFPIDSTTCDYDAKMLDTFAALPEVKEFAWNIGDILPKVLPAGKQAGVLTKEGALKIDPTGKLEAGIPMAPPEGDAGTGMVATNSVAVRTGNISAGTSVFAMFVLEKALQSVYEIVDMVTTPAGDAVAMIHCNNCTSDLNAWVSLFDDFAKTFGMTIDKNDLFGKLYRSALEGDKDCGGIVSYNYYSGEVITGLNEGRPMLVRKPNVPVTLANFMRSHLYGSLATLKIGCDELFEKEKIKVDSIMGHGGLFRTKGVGQSILAAALNAPVTVMETAGEGGPWGMAILAAYMANNATEDLATYLREKVFAGSAGDTIEPNQADVDGFNAYIKDYMAVLPAQAAAVDNWKL